MELCEHDDGNGYCGNPSCAEVLHIFGGWICGRVAEEAAEVQAGEWSEAQIMLRRRIRYLRAEKRERLVKMYVEK